MIIISESNGKWIARGDVDILAEQFATRKAQVLGDLQSPATTVYQTIGATPVDACQRLVDLIKKDTL